MPERVYRRILCQTCFLWSYVRLRRKRTAHKHTKLHLHSGRANKLVLAVSLDVRLVGVCVCCESMWFVWVFVMRLVRPNKPLEWDSGGMEPTNRTPTRSIRECARERSIFEGVTYTRRRILSAFCGTPTNGSKRKLFTKRSRIDTATQAAQESKSGPYRIRAGSIFGISGVCVCIILCG